MNALQVRGTSSSSLLLILFSCRGSHRSGERLNGHGHRQQPVLARSLASLTAFAQSSQQLSQALPFVTHCFDTLPRAWYGFVSVSCFTIVCLVRRCSLNVDNLLWIHSFFPFYLTFYSLLTNALELSLKVQYVLIFLKYKL